MNMVTSTKPNNMLFCFVKLSFNGYSKTVFDLKIAYYTCHSKLPVYKITIIKKVMTMFIFET